MALYLGGSKVELNFDGAKGMIQYFQIAKLDANVYTPEQYAAGWEAIE